MSEKECTKCGEVKPFSEYHKNKVLKSGLRSECKACKNIYYKANKEIFTENNKRHRENNPEYREQYYQENKKVRNDYMIQYSKKRSAVDPCFRMLQALRSRQRAALNGGLKAAPTMELLGCTAEQARQHLENQFTDGMSWDNYGLYGWHIDHIIPCASFDLSDPEQQKECFHYTNLQPLWAEDNLKKSDKILTQ